MTTKDHRGHRSATDRERLTWSAAGAALIALAAVGLACSARAWPDDWQTHRRTEARAYRHAVQAVVLDLSAGDIELAAGPPGRLDVQRRLKWSGSVPSYEERWDGDTFRARDDCAREADCSISYTVTLPAGATVTARTRAGDITVRALTGTLSLDSDAGNVTGVALAAARVTAATRAGNVTLGFGRAPARVEAASEAGQVEVDVPRGQGYLVQAAAEQGGTSVQVPQAPDAGHTIIARSEAGDVRVGHTG